MKKLGLMASAALAGLMSIGAAVAEDVPLKIVYASSADAGNAFWLSVKKGFDDACTLVGADCQMLFTGKVGDVQAQVANIQSAIAQSPDMIIVPIVDNNAFDEVIREARDAGITVLASNVDDTEGPNGNARQAFVGQDFLLAGEALGRATAAKFPAEGPIRVLMGVNAPADNWSRRRADGVLRALQAWKDAHPDRDISWEEIDAGLDYGTTGDRFGNYLTSTPDLTAYLDTGFWDVAAAKVMKDRGIEPGKIILGGFDLVPDVMEQMKLGYIQFHIDQQPYLQGYVPVIQAPLIKKFALTPFDVNTGSGLVTPDQVDAIAELSKAGYS